MPLERGEKVLAAVRIDSPGMHQEDSAWAVASDRALMLVSTSGRRERRGWELVDHGAWDGESSVLEVTWTDRAPPWRLGLPVGERRFPEVLRERVQASVVLSRRIDVRGRRGVRVAVRRVPGDGRLFDEVLSDPGVSLDDAALVARMEAVRADLREQAGLG